MVTKTVADLAERYSRGEIDNEEFYSQLVRFYQTQPGETKLEEVLQALRNEIARLRHEEGQKRIRKESAVKRSSED